MPVDLAAFAERNHDQVERNAAVDRRLALGLGHQRHVAALLEIAHRAEAAAFVGRSARNAEDAERVGRLPRRASRRGSRAGSSPRRRTSSSSARAFGIVDRRGVVAHLRPGAFASRAPRGERRRARGARSAASSWRPRASARSSSMYIIDSRRLLSPHSASTSLKLALVVARRRRRPGGAGGGWSAGAPAIALATESTRNGMSSLTMPMRIRRLPASPPVDSIASASSPRLRLAATSARNSAASRSASRRQALGFAGKRISGQRLANRLDQRLGPGACGPS